MAKKNKSSGAQDSTANLGFEAKLWLTADKLRNNMDAAEYKHVVLGLIFLKYISDSFDEHHAKLVAGKGDFKGSNPEDKDEYLAASVFWVPKEARWSRLQSRAKLPTIGKCTVPYDCIDSRRYPLFMARSVMRGLIQQIEEKTKGATQP